TTDEATIVDWLQRWPRALLATPTGRSYQHIAVDVDIKHPPISGFDAWPNLVGQFCPTRRWCTRHPPDCMCNSARASAKSRARKARLAPGATCAAKSAASSCQTPGSGYEWDPIWSVATVGLAPAPNWLIAPASERKASAEVPAKLEDAYAAAALADACRRIRNAPAGQQEATLNSECFRIGTLAGAGRCDVGQPVEDCLARQRADPAVSIEVRLCDFLGMEFQYQV